MSGPELYTVELDLAELNAVAKSVGISLSVAAKNIEAATGRRRQQLVADFGILSNVQAELSDVIQQAILTPVG